MVPKRALIDAAKFLRVKKRLGIDMSSGEIKKFLRSRDFFEDKSTIAVIHHTGTISQNNCTDMTNNAINILSSSQLIYIKRKNTRSISLINNRNHAGYVTLFLSKGDQKYKSAHFKEALYSDSYELSKHWLTFQKHGFFIDLLKIINRQIIVDKDWRVQLIKVANLVGKSLLTNEIVESFLWNMIALETLLLRQGDKYTTAIPERIESILGWALDMEYHSKYLAAIYDKRNKLVHDGDSSKILEEDVIFTDGVLFNMLMNIVKHPKIFYSKDDLIKFAEKVRAENILGIKSKVMPKGLSYVGLPPRMRE